MPPKKKNKNKPPQGAEESASGTSATGSCSIAVIPSEGEQQRLSQTSAPPVRQQIPTGAVPVRGQEPFSSERQKTAIPPQMPGMQQRPRAPMPFPKKEQQVVPSGALQSGPRPSGVLQSGPMAQQESEKKSTGKQSKVQPMSEKISSEPVQPVPGPSMVGSAAPQQQPEPKKKAKGKKGQQQVEPGVGQQQLPAVPQMQQIPQKPQQESKKSVQGKPGPSKPAAQSKRQDEAEKVCEMLKTGLKLDSDRSLEPSFRIPRRTAPGTNGIPFCVQVNLFRISFPKQIVIHYDFASDPEPPRFLYRKVFEMFASKHFPNQKVAFDGRKNVYANPALNFREKQDSITVKIEDTGREKIYTVKMTEVARVDLDDIRRYMEAGSSLQSPQQAIQAIDVVLRQKPMTLTTAGRSFFRKPVEGDFITLGEGLELWKGFFQSTVIGWKPYLNVDVAHKGFPIEQDVIKFFDEERCDVRGLLNPYNYEKFNKYIKGLKVVYKLPNVPDSKRVYRVNSVSRENAETANFLNDQGARMTVQQYYAREKRTAIRYPKLNLLHVGATNRNILIPVEFCRVVGGQVINKKLSETQTAAMVRAAAKPPEERKRNIMDSMRFLDHRSDPTLKQFHIDVNSNMEEVKARILKPPTLVYNGQRKLEPRDGVWRADDLKFQSPATLTDWIIVNMDDRVYRNDIERMIKMLCDAGTRGGMFINPQPLIRNMDSRSLLPPNEILKCLRKEKDNYPKLQLMFVIMSNMKSIYSRIKVAAELNCGILTQCIKSFTVQRKMNPATAYNILLKVNTKLNGVNHCLLERGLIFKVPVMIVGADVTHPSPDQTEIPSIAAVVASYDCFAFKYCMEFKLQPPRVEIIQDLQAIMEKMIKNFEEKNRGLKPQRIVFYRDGVSEGQFSQVLDFELTAIRNAINKKYNGANKPPVTFLVVQKRHHIRFFPKDMRYAEGRCKNIPPGTVVDSEITHPKELDFYLSSHASIQGTSRPSKYHLLWDDANMSTDDIEEMTYHLCYLFARCNRSVSYPAPTYYAHLIAFRARAYMEEKKLSSVDMGRLDTARHCGAVRDICDINPMFFV